MLKPSAIHLLARHAIDSLPDSLASRRQLLEAIIQSLPKNSELRIRSKTLLTQLEMHERELRELQGELPLIYERPQQ